MSRFLLDSEDNGLFCHLWFLKQHCLLLLFLLKSAPSTATLSKNCMRFGEGPGKLPTGMVVAKNKKKIKKIKKIQQKKIKKIYKKTWHPNIRVFACEPGSVLGYLITLLCTALVTIYLYDRFSAWRDLFGMPDTQDKCIHSCNTKCMQISGHLSIGQTFIQIPDEYS